VKAVPGAVRLLALAAALAWSANAISQPLSTTIVSHGGVFVRALREGAASEPLPSALQGSRIELAFQREAHSDAPLAIEVRRLERFVQQPRCGRVVYAVTQPETKRIWLAAGGQFNVCEDGQPPLRVCRAAPGILVPGNLRCTDGTKPVDTPEVSAATAAAYRAGGLSVDQLRASLHPSPPSSPLTTAAASAPMSARSGTSGQQSIGREVGVEK